METTQNLSATGANPSIPGMTSKTLDAHFDSGEKSDHSDQYPTLTKEQYGQRAVELAQAEAVGGIHGYLATRGPFKGSIVRYDSTANDWVRAHEKGTATMFKPNDGNAYYEKIKRYETGGNDDQA